MAARLRLLSGGQLRAVAILVALSISLSVRTVSAQNVIIITSDSLTSTTRTVSGAMAAIRQTYENASFLVPIIGHDASIGRQGIDSLKRFSPHVIISVGSKATAAARTYFPKTPIVFSSVLYPQLSGFLKENGQRYDNMTGASLDISVEMQFRHFKKIVPKLKRIGALYTANTSQLIPQAREAAKDSGFELLAVQVSDERDLPEALDSLFKSCQGFWSLADLDLFTPQATKYIMLRCLKRGIPVMGFSRNVVESGALFALDFDYKAVGRQAGGMAVQVLGGTRATSISVTSPDVIWFHYNERTARHIGISIPPDLMAVAKEVYR